MDIQKGAPVQQFFGKWPFWRFSGMQEPASVVFSLFNLWAHANGAHRIRKALPDFHPMKRYYLTWTLANMNTWIWSAVFHTRDTSMTEKLDYFSAALSIVYAFYYTIIRLFHLYTPLQNRLSASSQSNDKHLAKAALSVFCIALYLAHVSYLLLLPRFDYTYNMVFNLTIGLLHNILWLLYALPSSMSVLQSFPSRPRSYRPRFVVKPVYCVVITMLATSLEVFDFPPVMRIIDAHALWHLATVPVAFYWYKFLLDDASDPSWRDYKL
ncbi:hypothetical protein AX15_005007 [Amanita polypyramis BW_CC]|nr:hypothetical protein AX15_005007 [Amanita polypyramis BW_CC]